MMGYDLAARIHDAQGPPEPPYCHECDGTGKVELAIVAYVNVDGKVQAWPSGYPTPSIEVDCPVCIGKVQG